jgi:hypothetical protein
VVLPVWSTGGIASALKMAGPRKADAVESKKEHQMLAKSIAEIQAAYPIPCTTSDDRGTGQDYCVGGAICCAHGFDTDTAGRPMHFPGECDLAAVFERLNPGLEASAAFHVATQLICANDQGHFAQAWAIAAAAFPVNGDEKESHMFDVKLFPDDACPYSGTFDTYQEAVTWIAGEPEADLMMWEDDEDIGEERFRQLLGDVAAARA